MNLVWPSPRTLVGHRGRIVSWRPSPLVVGTGTKTQQRRVGAAYAEVMTRAYAAQSPQAPSDARVRVARDLEQVIAEHPSGASAAEAAYELGNLRYAAQQYAPARGAYEMAVARASSPTVRTLARASIGYTWEAERNFAKAVETYRRRQACDRRIPLERRCSISPAPRSSRPDARCRRHVPSLAQDVPPAACRRVLGRLAPSGRTFRPPPRPRSPGRVVPWAMTTERSLRSHRASISSSKNPRLSGAPDDAPRPASRACHGADGVGGKTAATTARPELLLCVFGSRRLRVTSSRAPSSAAPLRDVPTSPGRALLGLRRAYTATSP